jgi:hypothetical protein
MLKLATRPKAVARVRLPAVVAVAVTLAAGCTSHDSNIPTPTLSSPQPATTAPASPPAAPSSSAPPEPVLPQGCTQLLPLGAVQQAIGKPLGGQVTYLRAAAVPESGRTGRVTCDYGVTVTTPSAPAGATPTPTPAGRGLIEVSYITYVDAKTAAGRIQLTVQHDSQNATMHDATVAGKKAYVLLGKEWNELVMADGASTYVVEMNPSVLPVDRAPAALQAMAEAVLHTVAGLGAPASGAPASGPASSDSTSSGG